MVSFCGSMVSPAGRFPDSRMRLNVPSCLLLEICTSFPTRPVNSINGIIGSWDFVLILARLSDVRSTCSPSYNLWLYDDVKSSSKLTKPLITLGNSYGPLNSPTMYHLDFFNLNFCGPFE